MSGYTVQNLKESRGSGSPNFGIDPADMELRMAREVRSSVRTPASATSSSARTSAPRSGTPTRQQEEIYILVSGSARVKLEDEVIDMMPWHGGAHRARTRCAPTKAAPRARS